MAAPRNSDAAMASVSREKGANFRYDLTGEELATTLHDQIVGKTVLITGVTPRSIGAEAARVIALHSPKLLILASRTESTIKETVESIRASGAPVPDIQSLVVDLGSQKSVREVASRVLELTSVIDVLINNAGIMMLPEYHTSPEGVELQFAVNHLGHFLLTNLLAPALLKAEGGARVVTVTSAAWQVANVRFDDVNFKDGSEYDPFLAYVQSKCANIHFNVSLAQKLGSTGVRSYSVDPGALITNLSRAIPMSELVGRGWFIETGEPNPAIPWKSVGQAAASYIMAAFDPDIKDKNGAVIAAAGIDDSITGHGVDAEFAQKTWALSEGLVGQTFSY